MEVVGLYITSKRQRKQIEELKSRIVEDGYEVLDENKFVGKNGLESLRYNAAKGKIDIIYIHSSKNLPEKYEDQIDLLKEFWGLGIIVIFVNPIDQLKWQVLWGLERYKREKLF